MSDIVFHYVLIAWVLIAVAVFVSLFFVTAPYGRYFKVNTGPTIYGRLGWIIMEALAPIIFAACFVINYQVITGTMIVFLIMWEVHYVDRSLIYPITRRISAKPLPLAILAAGLIFNIMNAYLNSNYLIVNSVIYSVAWLCDLRFVIGLSLFLTGFIVNRYSDYILYRIRRTSQNEYSIPYGGLYHWISCPNYLGEIFIWIGWTIATWSPVAAAFSLWTIANLAPRARSHHRWYQNYFDNYPNERRALVPWIW
ncbi:DUF1295 domain-containing protein [Chloroflexota bacterium]